MSTSPVSLAIKENIAVITIDNPPVNALSQAVRQGLSETIEQAELNNDIDAIVLCCEGRTFIAGADITEFGKPPLEPHLPDVLAKLYRCTKPIVAAIHGTVLGGGFETALSCHYRIALTGTRVGLPEVNLGLIPGAGGTQLLPRICDLSTSLEMITSGKPTVVDKLLDQGVVDKLVKNNLTDNAISFAKALVSSGETAIPVAEREPQVNSDFKDTLALYRTKLNKKARGQIAPQRAIDSIENALTLKFTDGLAKEREFFLSCRASSQSIALRHAFFAEKATNKVPDLVITEHGVEKVAVIGAGTMGAGIAMCFANAGFPVTLVETSNEFLERGLKGIASRYNKMVSQNRITQDIADKRLALISGTIDFADLNDVDLVVEAAFESMSVKKEIFAKLDKYCKTEAILASNTSYLDIDEIATAVARPEQVIGMHFFSPANIMKLLEVIKCDKTSDHVIGRAMALGKSIGKIATLVKNCYGFVGNRMYSCYGREANMLLIEGATPEQIDNAMYQWGMAMGPLAVNDMSGIDIAYKARQEHPNLPKDPLYFRAANLMVEAGRLGQKTQAGFYRYDENGKKHPDNEVTTLFEQEAKLHEITRREISDEEIQERLILALVNEGARILDEEIAFKASDIDVIWLNGYGFPRYRGGPMCYAEQLGLDTVVAKLTELYQVTGKDWWKPSQLLVSLAKQNKGFS